MEEKNKTIIDKVWDLFSSVKLAIVIFSLIALTSMVGTILEQGAEPEKNVQILVKMLGIDHEAAHSILNILDSLGFTNMYHSWWFITLLLFFASNLIICSIDRLPRIIKIVREPIHPLPLELFEKMSIQKALSLKDKGYGMKDIASDALKKIGFRPSESLKDKEVQLYAEKGNFTRLGVYITHLSILLILTGAVIGLFFGFNAYLNLPEGASYSVVFSNLGFMTREEEKEREMIINSIEANSGDIAKTAISFGIDEKSLKTRMSKYGIHPLGFVIHCDNFEVDFYAQSDMPKSYISWLTVLKDGQEIMKKAISVNDPLKYEGITFYQSSFGTVPNGLGNGIFVFRVSSGDGKTVEMNLRVNDTFVIPGTLIEGHIINFSPALAVDQSGKAFTYDEKMTNPAVYIEFSESGNPKYAGWILKRHPQSWSLPNGNRVEFLDYWGIEYTGLQVRKDPGVFIVYLGCIVMAIGLFITFFMSHRRIWVNISEEKGKVIIKIGASANKNKAAFEKKIEKLVSILSSD